MVWLSGSSLLQHANYLQLSLVCYVCCGPVTTAACKMVWLSHNATAILFISHIAHQPHCSIAALLISHIAHQHHCHISHIVLQPNCSIATLFISKLFISHSVTSATLLNRHIVTTATLFISHIAPQSYCSCCSTAHRPYITLSSQHSE